MPMMMTITVDEMRRANDDNFFAFFFPTAVTNQPQVNLLVLQTHLFRP